MTDAAAGNAKLQLTSYPQVDVAPEQVENAVEGFNQNAEIEKMILNVILAMTLQRNKSKGVIMKGLQMVTPKVLLRMMEEEMSKRTVLLKKMLM